MPVSYSHNQYQGIWTLQQVSAAAGANAWPRQGEYYLAAWGSNRYGQLGNNQAASGDDNWANIQSPILVGTTTRWKDAAGGIHMGAGVKYNGTLWTWGFNNNGVLGHGNSTYYSSPKQVGTLTNWSKVSIGTYHALAIKTDGSLWAWGYNAYGQLGLSNLTYYSSPKQVGSLTNWASICAGTVYASFALKTDGTLWSWGWNPNGQLGLSNTTYYSSPKQVGALTNWSRLPHRMNQGVLAVKTDGTLWSWGNNAYGQLGLGGSGVNISSPTQVGALTNWSWPGSAANFTVVVKTNGQLWTWGQNNLGQLGLGNTTYYSSPKQLGALTDWSKTAGGDAFVMAIKTDGTLWSWGNNGKGQLGLGTKDITPNTSSPTQVGTGTNWYLISPGNTVSYALKHSSL